MKLFSLFLAVVSALVAALFSAHDAEACDYGALQLGVNGYCGIQSFSGGYGAQAFVAPQKVFVQRQFVGHRQRFVQPQRVIIQRQVVQPQRIQIQRRGLFGRRLNIRIR